MSLVYEDGDFTVATASGAKVKTFPFEGDTVSFFTEQDFMQFADNFAALPLNTQDPDDPLSFLVAETGFRDMDGGLREWKRIFARVPAVRNEYESFAYVFPGFTAKLSSRLTTPWALPSGTFTAVDDPGRVPQARKVSSRLKHEYFLVGAHGSYTDAILIPRIAAQRYTYGSYFGAFAADAYNDLPDRILWRHADYANGTSPTVEEYQALIAAGTEIVAEDSDIRRWKGNIYERVTRYLKAQ